MHRRRFNNSGPSIAESFDDARCDYEAAKRTSRFQRRRRGIPTSGASADYHYRSEADFLWMQEIARDLYRNDMVIGQMTDRAVINWMGSGLTPDPDTGDKTLDKDLKERWTEESEDPDTCDVAGELTFHEQELMVGREILVAGDTFGIFTDEGTVQHIESHRCRSPQRTQRNIIHGIECDRTTKKRQRCWFTKESLDPMQQTKITVKDLRPVDVRDEEGECQVMHVYSPKRFSQTRGVTAYAPIIIPAGMFDDLQFAHLLKSQLNAFWLLVRKREKGFFDDNPNVQHFGVTNNDFTGTRRVDDIAPGSEIGASPGEDIQPWNPNNPPAEFFPHAKLILTMMGINLGMPLVLVLMDASETNFSGFRGAIDQARLGFRHNQRILKARFHRPFWRFKLNFWADGDPVLAAARERLGKRYLKHKWNTPGWPYIEPTKDAQGDLIRSSNMQTSPRRLATERGFDWADIVSETVEDRRLAIETACEAAKKLNSQFKLDGSDMISWRDLAPLPNPGNVTIALSGEDAAEPKQNAKPKPKPAA